MWNCSHMSRELKVMEGGLEEVCTLTGGKHRAEGFGQRESVTVKGVGTAESAEQSEIRAESAETKQGWGE